MEAPKAAKKRKFTDKSLPSSILHSADFTDSKFYQELLDVERKLDWTISRKRAEIQDALGKPSQTTRTLRIFLSHTVSDQPWQTAGQPAGEAPNFETGQGIPSWALKVEGRLLESSGRSRDKASQKRFSNVVKHLVVDLERDPNLYPDGNTVEWRRPQAVPQAGPSSVDGFTVRRTGDSPTKVRVMMYLEHYPEQYKVHPELGAILDVKEESRIGIITALWNYIKINNLQDKVDRRMIRLDDKLKALFRTETLAFQQIPELVNHYLSPPDPILLYYNIKPNEPPPVIPQAWDVEIKMEDTSLKSRMNQVILNTSSETARDIAKYDEEAALLAQQIQNAQLKCTFLEAFATDPADFINKWLASQSRDLDSVLAAGPSEGLTVREEELKRSEFFRLPWVEEAVAVQEGLRMASRSMI
ncbi:SWI/SNF complex protein [Phellopilus nigrolimitatus]|nr:SWI/SNF complex protein [Phellopilus nigrolimitatus]